MHFCPGAKVSECHQPPPTYAEATRLPECQHVASLPICLTCSELALSSSEVLFEQQPCPILWAGTLRPQGCGEPIHLRE